MEHSHNEYNSKILHTCANFGCDCVSQLIESSTIEKYKTSGLFPSYFIHYSEKRQLYPSNIVELNGIGEWNVDKIVKELINAGIQTMNSEMRKCKFSCSICELAFSILHEKYNMIYKNNEEILSKMYNYFKARDCEFLKGLIQNCDKILEYKRVCNPTMDSKFTYDNYEKTMNEINKYHDLFKLSVDEYAKQRSKFNKILE